MLNFNPLPKSVNKILGILVSNYEYYITNPKYLII